MNQITIMGRMTKDPESRINANGTESCLFSVAVKRPKSVGSDNPSQAQLTDFFSCSAFGKTCATILKYLKKGDGVIVTGRMESWRSPEGAVKWGIKTERVEFPIMSMSQKNAAEEKCDPANFDIGGTDMPGTEAGGASKPMTEVQDEDLPF